eukprot:6486582-Amphidinium_carterae.3
MQFLEVLQAEVAWSSRQSLILHQVFIREYGQQSLQDGDSLVLVVVGQQAEIERVHRPELYKSCLAKDHQVSSTSLTHLDTRLEELIKKECAEGDMAILLIKRDCSQVWLSN